MCPEVHKRPGYARTNNEAWSRKGIGCYVDSEFARGWNKEEGKGPGSILCIVGYIIMYDNCPIIWASRLQTEIVFSKIEAKYIAISQAMRDVLPFMSLMKEISFVLELEDDVPKIKSSIFENTVIETIKVGGSLRLDTYPNPG